VCSSDLEEQGVQCEFALDDIYWEGGTSDAAAEVISPQPFVLRPNYPNPFNPSTTIGFSLLESADVRLEIYNLQGRKLKTLISARLGAGDHSTVWDGSDSAQRSLASGVYFYKLETGTGSGLGKCLLLK